MGHARHAEDQRRLRKLSDECGRGYAPMGAYYDECKGIYRRICAKSGMKRFYKNQTNRRVRHCENTFQHNEYQKIFDYWWSIS